MEVVAELSFEKVSRTHETLFLPFFLREYKETSICMAVKDLYTVAVLTAAVEQTFCSDL